MQKLRSGDLKGISQEGRNGESRVVEARTMVARLNADELEILLGVVAGESIPMTARRLEMSLPTAEDHRRTMMTKLGSGGTCDAVRIGLYAGLDTARRPA